MFFGIWEDKAGQSFMSLTRICVDSDFLSFGHDIKNLIIDRFTALIISVTANADDIICLEAELEFVDPSWYYNLLVQLDLLILILAFAIWITSHVSALGAMVVAISLEPLDLVGVGRKASIDACSSAIT